MTLFSRHVLKATQIPRLSQLLVRAMSGDMSGYSTLKVTRPREHVVQVELNRPEKRNAMNTAFWKEIRDCFQNLARDSDCRVAVLSAAGKIYTAGLDLTDLGEIMKVVQDPDLDVARKAFKMREVLVELQESFNVIQKCNKPVIAAIHSACVGGGVDMTSACDIRYCTEDAWFVIKETDLGIVADLGTLQRFPKIIGNDSLARELAFTARPFYAKEAKEMGFVSRIFPTKEALIEGALDLASLIASKSPVAVQGTKVSMNFNRDHTIQEGLDHIATLNPGMLQSNDLMEAATAAMQKKTPTFSKL